MKLRARTVDLASSPEAVKPYLGQTLVTTGKDYDAHALATYEGVVLYQIVDDAELPGWKPAWLFDVIEPTIPADWIARTFHDEPSLVIGPAFVAESLDAYRAMVELEPEQVDRFWKRIG